MPTYKQVAGCLREQIAGRSPARLTVAGFLEAAVLVPLVRRAEGPTLLFTRRSETVPTHRGQVAFPGGGREPGEAATLAALREAFEEIRLEASSVEVVGEMDDRPSISGFVVTPVVGLVENPPARFVPQESEVEEIFEVPLARLLEPGCVTQRWRDASEMPPGAPVDALLGLAGRFAEFDPAGRRIRIYLYDAGLGPERVVWGLTGYIVKELLDCLRGGGAG
ncbi:MAG: CoA pyrophosphatase [Candidatus Wallbacteria bacterium]|nr:CoA pyrophosphatase [Candidatus Wallbacteria bacterium]